MNERKERIMLICRIVFTVLLATCLGCGSKAIGPKPESDGVTPRTGSLVKTEKASEAEEKFAELSRRLETASEINKAEMKRTAERSDVVRQEVKGAYDEAFNGLDKKLKASEKASEDLIRDLDVSMARNNARLRELNEKMGERTRKKEQEAQEELKNQEQEAQEKLKNQKRRAKAEANAKAEQERRRKEATRIWASANGGQTMKAQFLFRIADKVKLKKEDGTEVMVIIDDLSDADREWITNRSKANSSSGN